MQTKKEIEKEYEKEDPWGYKTNPEDLNRKDLILKFCNMFGPYETCLDVGAGEGWITKDVPATKLYGHEISDLAAGRFPKNVERVFFPSDRYDLVLATGVLYAHYNYVEIINMIKRSAKSIVVTCNIKQWEIPGFRSMMENISKQILTAEFSYREWTQKMRVFRVFNS